MKLHLLQKIGLIGIGVISVISFIFFLLGHFSVYSFTFSMPFAVAILIGYSANNSRRKN